MKTKRILSLLAILVLLCTLLCGCGTEKIVGQWRVGVSDDAGERYMYYIFNEDGTVQMVLDGSLMVDSTYWVDGNRLYIVRADGETQYMFTYEIEKNRLTITDGDESTTFARYDEEINYNPSAVSYDTGE